MKCDELKVHKAYNRWIDEEMPSPNDDLICNEVYLKSEADKVIANLEKKLDIYKRGWMENDRVNANQYAEIRHHKYKRCLAMAGWCEATALWCYQAANTLPTGFKATLFGKPVMIEPDRLYNRFERLMKWNNRWLKIAEQFKEAK